MNGLILSPVAQFTFTLDNARFASNNASGIARFEGVNVGTHIVTETIPPTWQQVQVTPAGGVVTVTAGTNCAIVTFRNRQVVATSNFQVQKTDSKTTARVGDMLDYTITVSNLSTTESTNVTVVDQLPSSLAFVSSPDTGVSVNGQTVLWTIPSIPSAASRTVTLRAQVRAGTPGGTQIRNIVQVNGLQTGEDLTTISGTGNADLEISIEDDPDPVDPGDELTYEIEICNEGDDDLSDVTILQILPDDVEVIEEDGGDEDDGTLTWDLDIDADDCVTLEVTIEIDEDEYEDGDEIETVVLADGGSDEESTEIGDDGDDDDDDDDNDDDFSVTKEASQTEVFPGGIVEYVITVENDTGEDLTDITVEDVLSGGGFSIVDDGDADKRSGNKLTWEIDELDDGDSETIRYRISIDASAFPGQLIRNNVRVETDDGDFEDEAGAAVTVIGTLPQTGFGMGRNGSTKHLRPFRDGAADMPVAIWLSLALSGAGIGAGVARKYWFGI